MSRWRTQFDEHKIHGALLELRECISAEPQELNEVELAERRRFEKVVSAYQTVLGAVDPELLPLNVLDANLNHINQQILPQVRTYRDNGNVSHLVTANDQLASLLQQLAIFHGMNSAPTGTSVIADIEKQVDSFAASLAQKLRAAEERLKQLIDTGANQEKKLATLESKIEQRNQETDKQISEWQNQFSQAQETRSADYNKWRQEINNDTQAKVNDTINKASAELNAAQEKSAAQTIAFRDNYEDEISEHINKAKADYDAIRTLYGLVAETSVGGGYVQNAIKEGKIAVRWRWFSMTFIGFAAVWLFYNFKSSGVQFTWQGALMSVPLTVVLLGGAGYCAQQSTRHRNIQVQNRRFALEMAAIDPYLQSLPEPDRIALKRDLTARYFGQNDHPDGTTIFDEHATKKAFESLGQNVIKPLADILKTFK